MRFYGVVSNPLERRSSSSRHARRRRWSLALGTKTSLETGRVRDGLCELSSSARSLRGCSGGSPWGARGRLKTQIARQTGSPLKAHAALRRLLQDRMIPA
jgi:hypothetical protein